MLLRHYAPRRPLRLQVAAPLPGEAWLVWEDAAALPRARSAQRGEPAVVPAPWRVLGAGTGDAAAAGLYAALRDADAADGYGGIAVAPLPSAAGGAWEAIGDRLARAALGASDQPVRVVVFDLGGVVVRIARSWAERCAAAGVTAPAGVDGDEALAACADAVDALMCGTITTDDLAARLSAALGGALAAPALAALYDHQILGPYPGVADVVARLRVPHAILSNTSAGHWPLLLQDPVVASATARFASFELGRIKPAGALFDHVAATLQEPPGHLLLLDDGDANVAGARAAGWQAERIDPLGDVAAQLEALFMRRGLLRPREEIR